MKVLFEASSKEEYEMKKQISDIRDEEIHMFKIETTHTDKSIIYTTTSEETRTSTSDLS